MRGLVFAVALGAALAGAATAHAGTVTLSGGILRYDAAPGEANRVFVASDAAGMHLIDLGAPVTAGAGCTAVAGDEALCASTPAEQAELWVQIYAGDGDDYVNLSTATYGQGLQEGGAGDDHLIGGGALHGDTYDGGPDADLFEGPGTVDYSTRTNPVTVTLGDDLANDGEAGEGDLVPSTIGTVIGGHGADTLTATRPANNHLTTRLLGGDGNDHLTVTGGAVVEWLIGQLGADVLHANSRVIAEGGRGEDTIVGSHYAQALDGGGGNDLLRGKGGRDTLIGEGGTDGIFCGPGKDDVSAGQGNDTIYARDGMRDDLGGGPGFDRARIDVGLDRVLEIEKLF